MLEKLYNCKRVNIQMVNYFWRKKLKYLLWININVFVTKTDLQTIRCILWRIFITRCYPLPYSTSYYQYILAVACKFCFSVKICCLRVEEIQSHSHIHEILTIRVATLCPYSFRRQNVVCEIFGILLSL